MRGWRRVDLLGTRNGINTTFTIPNFNPAEKSWIIFNGRILYETNLAPQSTEEFRPTGNTVVFGLAPEATDNVWAILCNEASVILGVYGDQDLMVASAPAGAAEVYIQDMRRTFYFGIYVFNKQNVLLEIIEGDCKAISWSYAPVGGCLNASITLRRPFDELNNLDKEYMVEIWRDIDQLGVAGARLPAQFGAQGIQLGTAQIGSKQLRWSGFIRELEPVMEESDEYIILNCNGWSRQLEQIVVANFDSLGNPVPYVGQDVAAIVRDIIDNWVLAGSQIKRTVAFQAQLTPDTGIIVNSISFFCTAADALRTLAEIGGDCEWGVRADREFYFVNRNQVVKQTHVIGDRLSLYRPLFSADDTVNRAYVQGTGLFATINLGVFESGYQKERVISVGALSTPEAAALWAQGYAAKFAPGQSKPSGRLQIGAADEWIENVGHPTGLLRVIGGPVFVAGGDRLQSQLPFRLAQMYGAYTDESFRIQSITYTPQDDALNIDIDLGARGNSLADRMKSIEYKLSELRQAQV